MKKNIYIDYSILEDVISLYKSDMRSMINFLQSNQHVLKKDKTIKVLNKCVFDNISENIKRMSRLDEYF